MEEKNLKKKQKQISYIEKKTIDCPICNYSFHKEKMFTGSGRLISKEINDDLRRVYIPNKKYGLLYPLIYNITVCPKCFYAALPENFLKIKEVEKKKINNNEKVRKKIATKIFGILDFEINRTLFSGAASYFLAIICYSEKDKDSILYLQKAICALRCSWCCDDLAQTDVIKKSNWSKISDYFKFLANKCLQELMKEIDTDKYHLDCNFFIGPDLDFNYNFEGVLYLVAYLGIYYKDYFKNQAILVKKMELYSTNLSRIFGRGKYSSSKPEIFLSKSQELYNRIKDIMETTKVT